MSLATSFASAQTWSRRTARALRCEVAHDYAQVADRWSAMARDGAALAFQHETWLRSWYATLGRAPEVSPLLVTVVDASSGQDLLALPLVLRRRGSLACIEFADGDLTDYNAPILGPHGDRLDPAQLWTQIRRALPRADIFVARKMPERVGGRRNPLAALSAGRACRLSGNILHVPESYDDWHWGLERTFRKELERSLRVFLRASGAAFRRIQDPDEAQQIYSDLKRMQATRIAELNLHYALGEPQNEAFYDRLVQDGLADGSVILTALTSDTETVAALLGVRAGAHYAMVRLAVAGLGWRNCSPGRLVIERTMNLLHAEGLRSFDFTIGDYAYKRRLGAQSQPLVDLHMPLSWRGLPTSLRERARGDLRQHPLVQRFRTSKAAE